MKNQKTQAMKCFFKKYLDGCNYDIFEKGLKKFFNSSEIKAIANYLFYKGMELGYTQEDDDEIIEEAIKNIEKNGFGYNCYTF